MRKSWLATPVILALLLGVAALIISDPRPTNTPKVIEDWSRGTPLGIAAWNQPNTLAVEPSGERVHVLWFLRVGESGMRPHYVQLDGKGNVTIDRDVAALPVLLPRECLVLVGPDGRLHLFARAILPQEDTNRVLYYALSPDGSLIAGPVPLSPAAQEADGFDVVANRSGRLDLFWSQDGDATARLGGLFHQTLTFNGQPDGALDRINETGHEPAAQMDSAGAIHLAWSTRPSSISRDIQYAAFPGGAVTPTEGIRLSSLYQSGAIFLKPVIGLDTGFAYVFWTIDIRSGPRAGSADASYAAIPLGRPGQASVYSVSMPPSGTPTYLPYAGSFGYRQLAAAGAYGPGLGSDITLQPMAVRGQRQELPVLFAMAVTFRAEKLTQPVLAVFAGGLLKGHQVIARNPFYSLLPQGAADGAGNLHTTWLGKLSEGYSVYYASTAPEVKARLDRTEPGDLAFSAVSTLWGLASGLIFLPFVPLILLAPMGWLALYHLAGSGSGLDQRGGRLALAVAVLLYLAAKTVIFVSFFTQPIYGQPLPAPWSTITTCGVPLLIPAFSGSAVAFYIKRRGAIAVFPAFIFFALLDITLTIMIYGPVAFGTR
jgi:hypothetical protein